MSEANDPIDPIDPIDPVNDPDDLIDEKSRLLWKYGVDIDTFDEDALLKTLKRIEKAESLTVAQKKKLKELESKSSDTPSDIMTKADYAMEKFLDKNPELSEYTKELSEYTKKGLSLEDAKTLVLNSDKAKQNREKTNSLGLSDWEPSFNRTSISKDELSKLSQSEYNKVMADVDSGKVKLK